MEKKLLSSATARELTIIPADGINLKYPKEPPHIYIYTPRDTVEEEMPIRLSVPFSDNLNDVEEFEPEADHGVQLLTILKLYVFDIGSFTRSGGAEAYYNAIQAAINDCGTLYLYMENGKPRARLEVGLYHFHFRIGNARGRKCFEW